MTDELKKEVAKHSNPERAKINAWFFKTGVGQYGEGDKFAGLTIPQCRVIAKKFSDLDLNEIKKLLDSEIHEERMISLIILVDKFKKADKNLKKKIYEFYLQNAKRINNWDLVDASADKIVGAYLADEQSSPSDKDRKILYKLAESENLWERRIAVIATFYFIKNKNEYKDTFKVAEILLYDKHDLIQKAVGWMLREAGKKVSQDAEETFLKKHYKIMPRTMLRYAIERFPVDLRLKYLKGEI